MLAEHEGKFVRPEESLDRPQDGYLKAKLKKLECWENLSDKSRKLLLHWMKKLIRSLIKEADIPTPQQALSHLPDKIMKILKSMPVANDPNQQQEEEEYMDAVIGLIRDDLVFVKCAIKIATKIRDKKFKPKAFSTVKGCKLFKILPIHSFQLRFVHFDRTLTLTLNMQQFGWETLDQFLDTSGYNGNFQTDGYSICFSFQYVPVDDESSVEVEAIKKRKNVQDSNSSKDSEDALQAKVTGMNVSSHCRCASIDPGKNSIISAVYGIGSNSYQVRSLTSKEFYHNAGHHRMTERRQVNLLSLLSSLTHLQHLNMSVDFK
jgi:hypothetical protein